MKNNKKWIAAFLLPATLIFIFVYAFSIGVLAVTSFTDWSIGSKLNFVGLKNYIELFKNEDFIKSLINTVIWILLQSTVHVAIGVIFALILARKKWYFKFARTAFMIPNIISSAALGLLFLCIFNPQFGAVNSLIKALGFTDFSQNWFMDPKTSFFTVTITWLPFAAVVAILVLAEMAAIPEDIYEAARVDGATEFEIIKMITLPLLKNIIGTATILSATSMLQKLDIIMMTTSGGPGNKTLNMPMFIYQTALKENNFGLANTGGVYLIILGLIAVGIISKIYKTDEAV
ncbi:carbohydrate ABC transporter membrane protein 1, CUT1 family [Clostridium cavendishii DSM 21758]|uniref:Carbohydrate ABC transporter membrane protein 1, CUT1 family n=1 Tax=Clostridium cavendishii DSM 21758 TaxID=1121302 RepID=A0A1M6GVV1_9CLOT|nr:sugar ABC transporter permease [Clostridium cavendishii]SHJ14087.1 carbohydrate ABC transporter membrane protein 1, CUT1 family [Clostridium cavendishii DSM 21758]